MSIKHGPISYKGRTIGILTLTVAQLLIGTIHLLIGLGLLGIKIVNNQGSLSYDIYTIAFGSLILVFAVYIWHGKKAGWIGTLAALLFVITADSLTVVHLPSIPGMPWFAAPAGIAYMISGIAYLSLPHVGR